MKKKSDSIMSIAIGLASGVVFSILLTILLYNAELLGIKGKFFGWILWVLASPLFLSIKFLVGSCNDMVICLFKILFVHIIPVIFYGLIGGLIGYIVYKIKNKKKMPHKSKK